MLALAAIAAPLAAAEKEPPREAARESMPLKIANRTIISLRGPIAGYSAKERVESSLQRIDEVSRASTCRPSPSRITNTGRGC